MSDIKILATTPTGELLHSESFPWVICSDNGQGPIRIDGTMHDAFDEAAAIFGCDNDEVAGVTLETYQYRVAAGTWAGATLQDADTVRLTALLRATIAALVDHPEDIEIEVLTGEANTVLIVTVADSDKGQVIGKAGRNAEALRTLVEAWGRTAGLGRVLLDVER